MNTWIRIFLSVVMLVPATVLAGGESEPTKGKVGEREVPEWAQNLYRGAPEFMAFEVAGQRIRDLSIMTP